MDWKGNDPEIIILGCSLGGLVAGTLLSKRNHSVLLLKESGYQRSHREKGYRFVPKGRVDLYSQRFQFQSELSREFPKEVIQIEGLYKEMDDLRHLLMKMKV